ncbi:hypothetical protein BESB_075330 [Besnoitia besnoiti]|uniref:Uncharacterized protein n=1 Tax=Besnoitia besnoiti TaxID=94643 RepID=A0A2A9MDN5_BESBE|nr:uncharacterized protein BESB_075330 [Besnoitia besnoiti]PFH34381.1 hypothetical protein BESB_075330 [Besnoitia besnoiti]
MAASRSHLAAVATKAKKFDFSGQGPRELAHVGDSPSFTVLRKLCRTRQGLDRLLASYRATQPASLPQPSSAASFHDPSLGSADSFRYPGRETLICSPDALAVVAHALCRTQLSQQSPPSPNAVGSHSSSYLLKRAKLLRGSVEAANEKRAGWTKRSSNADAGKDSRADLSALRRCQSSSSWTASSHASSSSSTSRSPASPCSLPSSCPPHFSSNSSLPAYGLPAAPDSNTAKPETSSGRKGARGGNSIAIEGECGSNDSDVLATSIQHLRGFFHSPPTAFLSPLASHFLVDQALRLIGKDAGSERETQRRSAAPSSPSAPPVCPVEPHSPSDAQSPLWPPRSTFTSFSPANYSFILFSLSFSASHCLSSEAALRLLHPLPTLLPHFSLLDVSQAVSFLSQLPRLVQQKLPRRTTEPPLVVARGLRNQPVYRVAFSPGGPITTVSLSRAVSLPAPTASAGSRSLCKTRDKPSSLSAPPPAPSSPPRLPPPGAGASVACLVEVAEHAPVTLDGLLSLLASRLSPGVSATACSPLLPFDPEAPHVPIDAVKHLALILSAFSNRHYALAPTLLSHCLTSLFRDAADAPPRIWQPRRLTSAPKSGRTQRCEQGGRREGETTDRPRSPAQSESDGHNAEASRSTGSPTKDSRSSSGLWSSLAGAECEGRQDAVNSAAEGLVVSAPSAASQNAAKQPSILFGNPWQLAEDALSFPVAAKFFLAFATQCLFQVHATLLQECGTNYHVDAARRGSACLRSSVSSSPTVSSSSASVFHSPASSASLQRPVFFSPSLSPLSSPSPADSPASGSPLGSEAPTGFSASRSRPFSTPRAAGCALAESVAAGIAASLALSSEERHGFLFSRVGTIELSETHKAEGRRTALQAEALMRFLLVASADPADGEAIADCLDAVATLDVAVRLIQLSLNSANQKLCPASHLAAYATFHPRAPGPVGSPSSFAHSRVSTVSSSVSSSSLTSSLSPSAPSALPISSFFAPPLPSAAPSSPLPGSVSFPSSTRSFPDCSPDDMRHIACLGAEAEASFEGKAEAKQPELPADGELGKARWVAAVCQKLAQAGDMLSKQGRPHRRKCHSMRQEKGGMGGGSASSPATGGCSPARPCPAGVASAGTSPLASSFTSPRVAPRLPLQSAPEVACHRWPPHCFLPFLRGRWQLRLDTKPLLLCSLLRAWAEDPNWSTSALFHLVFEASSLATPAVSLGDTGLRGATRLCEMRSVASGCESLETQMPAAAPEGADRQTRRGDAKTLEAQQAPHGRKCSRTGEAGLENEILRVQTIQTPSANQTDEKNTVEQTNVGRALDADSYLSNTSGGMRSGAFFALLNAIKDRLPAANTEDNEACGKPRQRDMAKREGNNKYGTPARKSSQKCPDRERNNDLSVGIEERAESIETPDKALEADSSSALSPVLLASPSAALPPSDQSQLSSNSWSPLSSYPRPSFVLSFSADERSRRPEGTFLPAEVGALLVSVVSTRFTFSDFHSLAPSSSVSPPTSPLSSSSSLSPLSSVASFSSSPTNALREQRGTCPFPPACARKVLTELIKTDVPLYVVEQAASSLVHSVLSSIYRVLSLLRQRELADLRVEHLVNLFFLLEIMLLERCHGVIHADGSSPRDPDAVESRGGKLVCLFQAL